MTVAGGLLLAVASAAALNWGWVAQHAATGELPVLSLRRPVHSLRLLFGDLRWLTGFLVGIAGWVLYVFALRLAPLSLVQAVSAGGVALLAGFARARGAVLTRPQIAAVALSVAGLAALGASLAGQPAPSGGATLGAVGVWLALSAAAAAACASLTTGALAGGAALGAAAGILYAAGDVSTKAAVHGGTGVVFVPAVLAAHGLAFVLLQLAFQRGGALASAGAATLLTNTLPIVAGLTLFHERLPGGAPGAARVAAFAAILAGAVLLARPEDRHASGPAVPHPQPEAPHMSAVAADNSSVA